MKISVIVPVYNTKMELERCLSSICGQTYKNLEIICVDDGSSDGSEKIVDQFAKKDLRVKVVHQINSGESNARNVGLKMATGDVITLCDCDDWLDVNMYETMIQVMVKDDLDMVCSSWYKEYKEKSMEITNELEVKEGVFGQKQLLKYLYMRDSYRGFAYMWNKLYKAELLKNDDGTILLFDESLKQGGDIVFLAKMALRAKRIKYIERCFYHYYQREESSCHTKDLIKLRDWIKAYEIVLECFYQQEVEDIIIDYIKRFMGYLSSNFAEMAIEQENTKMLYEYQAIMRECKEIYVRLNQEYPERIERYNRIIECKCV